MTDETQYPSSTSPEAEKEAEQQDADPTYEKGDPQKGDDEAAATSSDGGESSDDEDDAEAS